MQWWSPEAVDKWQWAKVKSLLEHAERSVPYYQQLFAELGLKASDITSWSDFSNLPFLTKDIIQNNLNSLLTPGAKVTENHTGGSTGQPLTFYQDKEYAEWQSVSLSMGYQLCGFQRGDKQLVLWGSDSDAKWHASLKGHLWNIFHNMHFVNMFGITDRQLKQLAHDLCQQQPDFIWSYVSSLVLLADQINKDGLRINPKAVQTTAGTLYPSIRKKLIETFSDNIFDRYGCREVANIAHECSAHQGLHIFSFHNYVEVIDTDNTGFGRIVVTNLHNKAFPFIRYDIGDLGILSDEECKCGRSFPLLKRIIGRTVEVITSPSGKLIDGEFFTHLFYNIQGVKQFQVLQETHHLLVIKITKLDTFQEKTLIELEKNIKLYGDPAFEIKFEFVDEIKPLKSGKMSFVLSKVPVIYK
jgi:phenylacetate-CoA ligase